MEKEHLEGDENDAKAEMLSNIQQQLEELTVSKRRSSEASRYRDEIRKVTRQLKEA